MKFEIDDNVMVTMLDSPRNGKLGKVKIMYPAGMFTEFAIIQVDHGNGNHGQYTEDQLTKIIYKA